MHAARIPLALIALTAAVFAAGPPAAVAAPLQEAPEPASVRVSGAGRATQAPDIAELSAGVEVTKPTAKAAVRGQSAASRALIDAVKAEGVADRDVRTEGLGLDAVHDQDDQDNEAPPTAYRASQSFTITVRDVDRTGAVIQAVTGAAGDAGRIDGVAFDVADRSALRAKARAAAFADARSQAEQYARLSGHRLGRVVSIDEQGTGDPVPLQSPMAAVAREESVPVAPGELDDEVTVAVVYELE